MINFLKNQHILRKKIFFSKEDVLSLWVSEEVFNSLLQERIIRHLANDIYALSREEVNLWSSVRYILADKLNKGAYITWLAALDYHNLLYWGYPWDYFTWEKRENIDVDGSRVRIFIPTSKTPELDKVDYYITFPLTEEKSDTYTIYFAKPEQALIDMFFNSLCVEDGFQDGRLVKPVLKVSINKNKLLKMALETMDDKTIKSTKNLINWLNK